MTVNAVAGTHVVTLGLDLDESRRPGCLGFAIQREDRTEDERYWLSGMKTFAETDPGLGPRRPGLEPPAPLSDLSVGRLQREAGA